MEINFKSQSLKMSFQLLKTFVIQWDDHSGWFYYGHDGFMYGFLVMELTDFIYTPMSIDINVSFLAAGRPGKLDKI